VLEEGAASVSPRGGEKTKPMKPPGRAEERALLL